MEKTKQNPFFKPKHTSAAPRDKDREYLAVSLARPLASRARISSFNPICPLITELPY